KGAASIWVRIPVIKGNARQEIKMFWGKADAAAESKGPGVFAEAAKFAGVWHLNDTAALADSTIRGNVASNSNAISTQGSIGQCVQFSAPKSQINLPAASLTGIGGEITVSLWANVSTNRRLPEANSVFSCTDKAGARLLNMHLPFSDDVYWDFGNGLHGGYDRINKAADVYQFPGRWNHWVFTHNSASGMMKIYMNGGLWHSGGGSTMKLGTPDAFTLGGGGYCGGGRLDEFEVAGAERSADWVKLQYENQKAMQTLVGPLVQAGAGFSVSQKKMTVAEGRQAAVTVKAGGAQKIYWLIKRGAEETVAAVDRFTFTVDAGRITGDQALTLQCKAIYPEGVKTVDIPVTLREEIPEPVFTLKAPAKWDGRETIEVVPQITNLKAMQGKGVGELKQTWSVSGLAVIKETAPGKLILKRSQNSGKLAVALTVSNGGGPVMQTVQIMVKEPKTDAWVQRTPGKDENPADNQFYARDDKNEGTLYYNGTLSNAADSVFLKLYADGQVFKTERQKLAADKAYAFSVKLKAGLIKYKVEFGSKSGTGETILQTVTNLVCGDAYLINGQSNALAVDWGPGEHTDTSEWIRSFRDNGGNISSGWGNAVRRQGGHWEIGCWAMDLAKLLVEREKIPVCMMNGAVGGTLIEAHPRNPTNRLDQASIYGRLFNRIEKAGLTHGIRGAFWHQGECNQGAWGEMGGYGWETHERLFLDITSAWKQDFPNIQQYYIFQIWPNACSIGGNRHSDKLRDVQRLLPRLFSNMSITSTLGIKPGAGCHFWPAGYAEIAAQLCPLVQRGNYGKVFDAPITPPDVLKASYTSDRKDEIALEFDQPVVWTDLLASQFYPDGKEGQVTSGVTVGNVLKLRLTGTSMAKTITYLADKKWSNDNLLYGVNGIAALTFFEVPIEK
ncbi:MAG: LamG-like jellyroll fold domain-containing protein, partial [bacterium]